MNFASFAPVNYGIDPMELTPLTKRMSDVLTLADMMDKSKANKLAIKKAQDDIDETYRKRKAQEVLSSFYDAPEIPVPVVPEKQVIGNMTSTAEPVVVEDEVPSPPYQAPLPGLNESVYQEPEPAQTSSVEQIQTGQSTSVGQTPLQVNYDSYGEPKPEGEQEPIVTVPGQVPAKSAQALEIEETRERLLRKRQGLPPKQKMATGEVPEAYNFLTPAQFENYKAALAIHPDVALDYLTKMSAAAKTKRSSFSATEERYRLWDEISAMPEGPEKDKAKDDFLMKVAPSLSQAALDYAVKREKQTRPEKILTAQEMEEQTRAGKTQTAASTAAAAESARTTAGAAAETKVAANSLPGFRVLPNYNVTMEDTKLIKQAEPDIEALRRGIREIRDKYKKTGMEFTGNDAAWYESRIKELKLLAKGEALYKLGVLAGPDMGILTGVLPDPSSIKEGLKKLALGDLDVKFKAFEDHINNKSDTFYRVHGFQKMAPAIGGADESGFIPGQVYKDAQGNEATYLGNGKWKEGGK